MANHYDVYYKDNEFMNRIREIGLSFPGAEEKPDELGHITFKVKDKTFVRVGEREGVYSASLRTSKETQSFVLSDQSAPYYRTPYVGQHGWISVASDADIDWEHVKQLAEEAYLRTAPKKKKA
ncbi:MmcQ/YjbR family DNA-binding protein [Paenibacillus arenilitoris]|uniref:MmcQ/YjbR family DNA-binding protein n=1 Tax=Paenibacillus arenilitoris TaxID=2772299 RepID=A0A927CQU5_9BACL|nr:MmcQ/YjbR family DNA-binding protein [Paenibacillus arenilitoris]MBD2871133.1 MmcQ/YjbR family DNA-binding protein [Paenibacillus arenilitoris]